MKLYSFYPVLLTCLQYFEIKTTQTKGFRKSVTHQIGKIPNKTYKAFEDT